MRRARIALAALALSAAAPPAAAEAASSARFVASLEGRQVTSWEQPRYQFGTGDCKGTPYRAARGSETIAFRTSPARLLAYRPNPRAGVTVKYGTWSRFAAGRPWLNGTGSVDRAFTESLTYEAGPCGAPPPPAPRSDDCGTERWRPVVRLAWTRGRVEVDADGDGIPFLNCEIQSPPGVEEGDLTDGIGQRYPARDLFDPSQGLVEVLGRRTFTAKIEHGTTTTTVRWKLRLRRAGR